MSKAFPKSPYVLTGGIVHFARMVDKIRLQQSGDLAPQYMDYLGIAKGFDGRCCTLLHIDYKALVERVKQGGADEEILEWCFSTGYKPSEDEIFVWNSFLMKRGWRDSGTEKLQGFVKDAGFENHQPAIETFFDFIEVEEGRPARCSTIL